MTSALQTHTRVRWLVPNWANVGSGVVTLDSSCQLCLSVPRSNQGRARDLAQVWQGSLGGGWQTDPSLLLGKPLLPSLDWGAGLKGRVVLRSLQDVSHLITETALLRGELSPVSQTRKPEL